MGVTGSVNTREPVGCKLRAHSRQYTLERNAPLTLWRPIEGYLLTFDKGIALQRERAKGRTFTLLLKEQTLWPLQQYRLYRLFNLSNEPLLVGWLSRDRLQALLLVDSALAYDCIRQMIANSNKLTIVIGQQMQRTALSYLAGTLLTLWEWSDRRFIHCTQAELAMVLNTYRESMTVWLHTLQRRGLIRLHYRRIEIVSLYGLRQLAEDY